jgi:O-antigen/teichoic acid export membrane protein
VFGVANLVVLAAMAWRAGTLAWRASKPAEDLTCRMTRFARQGYGLSLLTFIVRDRSEVLVLGALATAQQVGFYSVALGAAEAAMRLGPWIVASVFFPLIAAGFADPDRQAIRTRYAQCLRYLALTAAPLALGGIALSEAGVAVVFGSAYAPMVPVLRVTLVAAAAAALAQGPAALLTVAERQDWILRVRAPLALANLILNVALVPRFAALGAAWANLAVAAAEAFVLGAVAWRFDGWAPLASMGHTFAAAAASAGVATLVLAGRTDAAGLLSSMLLAVVVYVLVLVISRFFRPEDAQVLGPLLEHTRFASMVRHRRFGRGLSVSSPK